MRGEGQLAQLNYFWQFQCDVTIFSFHSVTLKFAVFTAFCVKALRGGCTLMIKVMCSFYTVSITSRRPRTFQSRSVSLFYNDFSLVLQLICPDF